MHCKYCGVSLPEKARFCRSCGRQLDGNPPNHPTVSGSHIGYSPRINDPAFVKYIKAGNRWSGIFSIILAAAAIIGFSIYGETSSDMDNPQALFIGLGIGAMFLLIALFTIIARKRSKTWDGVVVDKTIKKKTRRQSTGSDNDDYYIQNYIEYAVIIRDQRGKNHYLTAEDDDTKYNYYQVGDQVRHHAGLKTYEKYDKSRDSIIFCNACATLCNINDDVCYRCKCPLLK